MFLYLLYTTVTRQEDMPSAVFDTVGYLLLALILGLLMARIHHIPLLHTFTAAVLCTFVVNTANNTMLYVVEEYSPLFDRQHFLAFVRLDVPYMLTVGVALLAAAILKRSGFYRYFSAMFRTLGRRLWISHSGAKVWDTPVNNRGVPFFYSFLDYFRLRLEIRLHQ